MPVIDSAIYVDGVRVESPTSLEEAYRLRQELHGFAWIGLYRPTAEEWDSVSREFDLHPLAVEDGSTGHQRAKVERYDRTLFVVLRPARYDDARERVEFGEVHLFVGHGFVISIRLAESPDLAAVRQRLESTPDLLRLGSEAVLYAVLDRVVDDYEPVIGGIENDIDEIEDQLFGDASDEFLSRRIYELYGEAAAFGRAVHPLIGMIERLRRGYEKFDVDLELRRHMRDVLDNVTRVSERVQASQALLDKALTVHSALVARHHTEVSMRQDEQVKKISGWAAIIFAPSLIAGIYGMNFDYMPELHWPWGYPMAIGMMLAFAGGLYAIFRSRKWL